MIRLALRCFALACLTTFTAQAAERPNILYIMADDHVRLADPVRDPVGGRDAAGQRPLGGPGRAHRGEHLERVAEPVVEVATQGPSTASPAVTRRAKERPIVTSWRRTRLLPASAHPELRARVTVPNAVGAG